MNRDNILVESGRRWEFDQATTDCFANMLERSIPDYSSMRGLTTKIARRFVTPRSVIADIGCSRGDAIAPLVDAFGAQNTFVLQDVSEPMLAACRMRFSGMIGAGVLRVESNDIRKGVGFSCASVVLSVLTLQFTPIEYRHQIVESVFNALNPGGALLLVEKVLGNNPQSDRLLTDLYLDEKREHAYTEEQIASKRKALEGVLVPVSAEWNRDFLVRAGFKTVCEYWRYLNFVGFMAVK